MRMFIAVPLSQDHVERTLAVMDAMRRAGSGNFTRRENLHITLEFLGELSPQRAAALRDVIRGIQFKCFDITIGRQLGCFGSLWWLSIESKPLFELQSILHNALIANGFEVETRPYHPHLTLVREFRADACFDRESILKEYPPVTQHAERMVLYQSERINGRLTYLPVETNYFAQA